MSLRAMATSEAVHEPISQRERQQRADKLAYGRALQHRVEISWDDLSTVLIRCAEAYNALRLGVTLAYLERSGEVSANVGDYPMRLETWLVGMTHNLTVSGMRPIDFREHADTFELLVAHVDQRSDRTVVVHASQILIPLSLAIRSDPTREGIGRVRITVSRLTGERIGAAEVAVDDGVSVSAGELSLDDIIGRLRWLLPSDFKWSD